MRRTTGPASVGPLTTSSCPAFSPRPILTATSASRSSFCSKERDAKSTEEGAFVIKVDIPLSLGRRTWYCHRPAPRLLICHRGEGVLRVLQKKSQVPQHAHQPERRPRAKSRRVLSKACAALVQGF